MQRGNLSTLRFASARMSERASTTGGNYEKGVLPGGLWVYRGTECFESISVSGDSSGRQDLRAAGASHVWCQIR